MDRSLALLDVMREHAGELHARCSALERLVADRDRRMQEIVALMPVPVVATDRAAIVIEANRPAAALLSRSPGRLRNELLLHYAEDREAFSALVQRLPSITDAFGTRLRIRPRERPPIEVGVTVARDVRDDRGNLLWFFSTS